MSIEYWSRRAKTFGKFAVINMDHGENEYEKVTREQKNELFPILQKYISGQESVLLDFGCGMGRFTTDLANFINGQTIGMDPIEHFLSKAPVSEKVQYLRNDAGQIPLNDNSVDVVWVYGVLCAIEEPDILGNTVKELQRVIKRNGVLFLVENTTEHIPSNNVSCIFRQVETYQEMFQRIPLQHVHDYYDLGQRMSVLVGNKTG